MIVSVHQPQYLPWLGFFDKIAQSDCFVFLDTVQYKEREFQNRNRIRSADGWMWLTVPVVSKDKGRQRIDQVRIDVSSDWQRSHWESLRACYGKAPFFKEYSGFFESLYAKPWDHLCRLNIEIIQYMLKSLSIDTPIRFESELKTQCTKTERIIELCKKLDADTYLSGTGAREYLEEEKFARENIRLIWQEFDHPAYRQQFMKTEDDFLMYMSCVDLLFNEGPRARTILSGEERL